MTDTDLTPVLRRDLAPVLDLLRGVTAMLVMATGDPRAVELLAGADRLRTLNNSPSPHGVSHPDMEGTDP